MFPLYDENPRSSKPYVNYSLIIINILVFIWEVIVTRSIFLDNRAALRLMLNYGFVPMRFLESIREGNLDGILTIYSSMFMHGGIFHLLGNMLFLWIFGDNIEDRFGHVKYLLTYLLFGTVATLIHLTWVVATHQNPLIPAVGASGAISGVLGSYMLIFPKARIITLVFFFFVTTVRIPAFAYIFTWFIYQVMLAPFGGSVAYLAHIGGFAAGVGVAALYKLIKKRRITIIAAPKSYDSQPIYNIVKPLRIEGIITPSYVEIIAEMPGIDINTLKINVLNTNLINIEGTSEDGRIKYEGKAILRVSIYDHPETIHYLNGILTLRFRRL